LAKLFRSWSPASGSASRFWPLPSDHCKPLTHSVMAGCGFAAAVELIALRFERNLRPYKSVHSPRHGGRKLIGGGILDVVGWSGVLRVMVESCVWGAGRGVLVVECEAAAHEAHLAPGPKPQRHRAVGRALFKSQISQRPPSTHSSRRWRLSQACSNRTSIASASYRPAPRGFNLARPLSRAYERLPAKITRCDERSQDQWRARQPTIRSVDRWPTARPEAFRQSIRPRQTWLSTRAWDLVGHGPGGRCRR